MLRLLSSLLRLLIGLSLSGMALGVIIVMVAYPKLPDIQGLSNYQPRLPLRVYSADNVLIGEFGEERRNRVAISEVPERLRLSILAAEDDNFYEHNGIDWMGFVRAALNNLQGGSRQGASTITMQVARNFYLSSEQTYTRKFYEILLSYKIEKNLTKDQILELYINQIFLGQKAYGFAAASQIYFGKTMDELTLAEMGMLAAVPKSPSAVNPINNYNATRDRQQYVLRRMLEVGNISQAEYQAALNEEVIVKPSRISSDTQSHYVAELARQLACNVFPDDCYTMGLNVYTTVNKVQQDAAYQAVRTGILNYERRFGFRGPEGQITIADGMETSPSQLKKFLAQQLKKYPDDDNLLAAVVLSATPKEVQLALRSGEIITITEKGLKLAQIGLKPNAPTSKAITRGSVVRVLLDANGQWELIQKPKVQSALISINPTDGAIQAMIGGFDFKNGEFNRTTQAMRQPGSGFKPFIYTAAFAKGIAPSTVVSDAPFELSAKETGSQVWRPKNSDGTNGDPMSVRTGLIRSRNLVTIRVLDFITPKFAQDYITHFGFKPEDHPPYLTMGLGAGAVTPLQMSVGYSVFANGGFLIDPYLITKATDAQGNVVMQAAPRHAGDEQYRAIDERYAYMMNSMLKDVASRGTASGTNKLKRNDIAGKTGTTNKAVDTWFNGYTPHQVTSVWMGYDDNKPLGNREFGASSALPIWVDFMSVALKDIPQTNLPMPKGIVRSGDLYLKEFGPGQAIGEILDAKDKEARMQETLQNILDGNWSTEPSFIDEPALE